MHRRDLLRWQFDLVWSLLDYHLQRLTAADLRWEPAATCWTLRLDAGGSWVPDWEDHEPDPIPVPTIGWIIWHVGWWWSVTIDHTRGRPPRHRTEIAWPGDGEAVEWLHGLRAEWSAAMEALTDADLDRVAPFPWQNDPQHTVAHMVAWVNAELMKNAAEIGQLRLVRAAQA
ncbi:DinB family protein [Pseudonocardia xinjiangensis]|uniref:DinB family protein n=1 Tax=Pseudonocardia xinjiangensis TaxID=75289 RepID=UPI003D8EC669